MNQTTKDQILRKLREIELVMAQEPGVSGRGYLEITERIEAIRKLLTDQSFNITAIPE